MLPFRGRAGGARQHWSDRLSALQHHLQPGEDRGPGHVVQGGQRGSFLQPGPEERP